MMEQIAHAVDGIVVNVIGGDSTWAAEAFGGEWVDATGRGVVGGSSWDGENFVLPEGVYVYFEGEE